MVPMAIGSQVWLVTPNDAERDRYYFVPEAFRTVSGNVVEAGSGVSVFEAPWSQVTHVKAYRTSVIPPYGTLPARYCADLVIEVAGKSPSKESICSENSDWHYAFDAKSPSLGAVKATSVSGRMYNSKGLLMTQSTVLLDNAQKWDLRVLNAQEADAARKQFR
jgi:hypothetical protein